MAWNERKSDSMRIKLVLGIWLLGITLAWLAVAPADLGVSPLVNTQGAALGWWQLRQHALYLTGLWSISLMALIMLLALRLPLLERVMGGMDQVYRLHKWTGIAAALAAVGHWGAKELGGVIKSTWGRTGKPEHAEVLAWLTDARGFAKDLGEWAFYLLIAMVVVTLLTRLLSYRQWRVQHQRQKQQRHGAVQHAVALMPLTFWALPLGAITIPLLALGSLAAVWSLVGWVGRVRNHAARIQAVQVLADGDSADPSADPSAPIEVICAMPPSWPGHRAGQFAFVCFEGSEGAHPFTIASAPNALGTSAEGEPLLRLVIKPLGDYTRTLRQRLRAGQRVDIEGPYGCFDGAGARHRQQVWVAAGVGVTPFLALLEARQPGARATDTDRTDRSAAVVQMHYSTRDAQRDPLLARLQTLCAQAQPPVQLTVHNGAQGQRLTPQDLQSGDDSALDIWFCGPQGLGDALYQHASGLRPWRLHRESFVMR